MANQTLRQSEIESLQYISSMTNELVQMAEASRFPMISYLLGMAYAEAFDILRGARPSRQGQAAPAVRRKSSSGDNRAQPRSA